MASEKTCFKCLAVKPLTEFYAHPQMGDGHLNKCKECTKRDAMATRAASIEKYREDDRQRAVLPHRRELCTRMVEKFRAAHPERSRAHSAVQHAPRAGRLVPLPCFVCGEKAEAHHPDYSTPLAVVWLCPAHHKQAHALVRNAS